VSETRVRVRANRRTGELEIEGPLEAVTAWWDKLWPEIDQNTIASNDDSVGMARNAHLPVATHSQMPQLFGEFYTLFRSDVTDVDKVLIAAAFVQGSEQERSFTTKAANQALLDQNVKVTNASQCVRRLIDTKRVFVVSDGKFRVSATGLEHLNSLKVTI